MEVYVSISNDITSVLEEKKDVHRSDNGTFLHLYFFPQGSVVVITLLFNNRHENARLWEYKVFGRSLENSGGWSLTSSTWTMTRISLWRGGFPRSWARIVKLNVSSSMASKSKTPFGLSKPLTESKVKFPLKSPLTMRYRTKALSVPFSSASSAWTWKGVVKSLEFSAIETSYESCLNLGFSSFTSKTLIRSSTVLRFPRPKLSLASTVKKWNPDLSRSNGDLRVDESVTTPKKTAIWFRSAKFVAFYNLSTKKFDRK